MIEEPISISQEDLQKGDDDALYTLKDETKEDETICMKESGREDIFETQNNQVVADEVSLQFYKILSLCEKSLELKHIMLLCMLLCNLKL